MKAHDIPKDERKNWFFGLLPYNLYYGLHKKNRLQTDACHKTVRFAPLKTGTRHWCISNLGPMQKQMVGSRCHFWRQAAKWGEHHHWIIIMQWVCSSRRGTKVWTQNFNPVHAHTLCTSVEKMNRRTHGQTDKCNFASLYNRWISNPKKNQCV